MWNIRNTEKTQITQLISQKRYKQVITGNPKNFRKRIFAAEKVMKYSPWISKFELWRLLMADD